MDSQSDDARTVTNADEKMDQVPLEPGDSKDVPGGEHKTAPGSDDITPVPLSFGLDDALTLNGSVLNNTEHDEKGEAPVIVSGADVARLLLPLRDDGDPSLTFRSIFISTGLVCFQAVLNQIYWFKPSSISLPNTFIVVIGYFVGKAWTTVLPRGDQLETRWRAKGRTGRLPWYITLAKLINSGEWGLKEHAIAVITAGSASNVTASTRIFAAQRLFYGIHPNGATVALTIISTALIGYGYVGVLRPLIVWQVESVYWGLSLPTVKMIQGLHWDHFTNSKPLRWFWYAYVSMFCYEWIPAYIWPWLNSVSIPCLAAMHTVGTKAANLTNIFGGSLNNEGLGLFSLSFDWQYTTTQYSASPLKWQITYASGTLMCYAAMAGIYYSNAWQSLSQPFMSTSLHTVNGTAYPLNEVFTNGVLDQGALGTYGPPRLAGTYAYGLFTQFAAIGALCTHCIVFWGKDLVHAFKGARKGEYDDPHHAYMRATYKEAPWYWFSISLLIGFVFGLIVVVKEHTTMPVWAYFVSLLLGAVITPFSGMLYARFGNGVATNSLSKMVGGFCMPGKPIANMFFQTWSHEVIANTDNMAQNLKTGEYLKIPPRIMFLTQIYGTILGGFLNYVMEVTVVTHNADVLASGDGSNSWSGANEQSYNTDATTWALASYLYTWGRTYYIVPMGLLIGAVFPVLHWVFCKRVPSIRGFKTADFNWAQFITYAGYIPSSQSQTCIIGTQIAVGFYLQYYIRNFKPRIFRDYSYLVTGAWDGGVFTVLFILAFAVFGGAGNARPFPQWWGNNQAGNLDLCPAGA